ncbi:MAG: pyridoxamine 5'-phosphate oxidase family protein [Anaerostipes sp.]|nr:pyridoxamine 5'-phosphate oxidase family protein [Anaerostipes sp.]
MFRKMRRWKQQISNEECIEILNSEPRGVLGVYGEDGYPYTIPLDFIYRNEKLYFHCAKEGHKLDAIKVNDKVSFCVMDEGFQKDGQWELNIKSVVIFGRIKKVDDMEKSTNIVRELGLKYYPTTEEVEEVIEHGVHRFEVLELTVDHMTGKLVNEK